MNETQRMKLTDSIISRLNPGAREYTVWDTRVPGLGVRVRPSGGASYVFLRSVGGRSKRLSLGPVSASKLETIRRKCHALMAEPPPRVGTGSAHPVPLFRDFVTGPWQDMHFSRFKPSTQRGVRSVLNSQLLPAFGTTPLDRITRKQILRWFDAYSRSAPGGANSAFASLRHILNFAVACGHMETSPTRAIRTNRRRPMTRFLSREEVRRLNGALDDYSRNGPGDRQQAEIIRLLLLTGCRKGEILNLRWSEVHGDTLVLADSKTGPRTVPLNTRARRILESQPSGQGAFVFPSPCSPGRPRSSVNRLWNSIRRDAGIEDVRLHDLRHTVASHAVMSGVPVPVVSRLLGHSNVRMTLRYAHLQDRDVEEAAERIGKAMAGILKIDSQSTVRKTKPDDRCIHARFIHQ